MNHDLGTSSWTKLGAPRRDPGALGFGAAFVLLGGAGLLKSAGVPLHADSLAQIALVVLGAAGLLMLVVSNRRR